MKKYSADYIFDGRGKFHEKKVLICEDDGTILGLEDLASHEPGDVNNFSGQILCPGFVNAHCHLELSHMKGLVDTGTTLLPFLQSVVKFRDFPQEVIDEAIIAGDKEMYEAGIVAVGDISNKADTAKTKSNSSIDYYTFVEMFDFMMPFMTEKTIEQYKDVYEAQSQEGRNRKSFVPHAPYTVSPELFRYINEHNDEHATVSIHNQETPSENELFVSGTGGFMEFFKGFGFDMSGFKPTGKRSLDYAISHMKADFPTLFVHNTTCTASDLSRAQAWRNDIYWVTCPNANLYIENRLPDYQLFLDEGVTMTVGTDSLTSNWHLSIIEELMTIQKYCSYVGLGDLLTWATYNGARALQFDDLRGSFEKGKRPGVLALNAEKVNDRYRLKNTQVSRLI